MSDPSRYLASLAQALAKMSLYAEGHPARARAADVSFAALRELQRSDPRPRFTFLGREVIYQRRAMPDLSDWDWAERLSGAGVQRLEIDGDVTPDEYRAFLEDVSARTTITLAPVRASLGAPSLRPSPIRFGALGVRDPAHASIQLGPDDGETPDLSEEADAVEWIHAEARAGVVLPVAEADLVVASLSHAMHSDQKMILPLLTLKEFDQYTTTHAINVAVLAMSLAEHMGLSPREVRGYGLAGLLHDLGKVHIPLDILRRPGTLSPEERAVVRRHPLDGAQMILRASRHNETCAAVAFEHHIMIDGTGYPDRHRRCDCHHASLLVHVCDVFDALRTNRPYRVAWETPAILEYIGRRIGTEFDAEAARAFLTMTSEAELRLATASTIDAEPTLMDAA